MFPAENLTGRPAPTEALVAALEVALAGRGVEVVSAQELEPFLARHRIRHTGGIGGEVAQAAKAELKVEAVLLTSIGGYQQIRPPQLAIAARLVSTGLAPEILWMEGIAAGGDDQPGAFGLGELDSVDLLQTRLLRRLVASLGSYLEGRPSSFRCATGSPFAPKVDHRSWSKEAGGTPSVAVLPFVNDSPRRHAGQLVALEFVNQLAASDGVRVLEPGRVREMLLGHHVVMEGGVTLAQARQVLDALDADLVLVGRVREFHDPAGAARPPRVDFTVLMLERKAGRIVWHATSYNQGDDAVVAFDFGKVNNASALTCRMARAAVERLVGGAPGRIRKMRGST